MTHVYRRHFRVRGYKVDGTSRVHDSVFLNYVQQAAFEASADAGYDTRRYDALGSIWVIRKQTIGYLLPLFYDDTIELITWVSDVRRVRFHREYELRRAADGQAVALARADWVCIDAATLFPRRIPQDIIDAFGPSGRSALDTAPAIEPAPTVNGCPFVFRHRVPSYELDNLRHVNKAFYAAFPDQAHVIDDLIAEGNKVAGRSTAQATHKGTFEGIAPTDRKVSYSQLHIATVVDGKFKESWVLEDNLGLVRQIGMELRPAEATD